jgi:hypothetical protein
MLHLSVVASSSRLSLRAARCFDAPIMGRLRFWVSSGALGVLLIILRREILPPLESGAELWIFSVSIQILGHGKQHYHALARRDECHASTYIRIDW